MKKVHISLVGGQPVPVYIGIKDDGQASTVVLVCSAQSMEEGKRISMQFPKRNIVLKNCSPVNIKEIESLAATLDEEYREYEKTINLTSGTKLWSLAFFQRFAHQQHVKIIYVDQTNMVLDILGKTTYQSNIDALKRFELYGTPLSSYRSIEEYTQDDKRMARELESLRRKNRQDFSELTINKDIGSKTEEEILFRSRSGSILRFDPVCNWALITLKTSNGIIEKEMQSEHLKDILFNAGWFELKTALALKENKHVRNIWMNCMFTGSEGFTKNEIDIIVELENRLMFVECKTMIHEMTDIDKFKSALRNFSGTSSTGLFVTNDKPNERTEKKYEYAIEKCADNGIATFNFSNYKDVSTATTYLNQLVNEDILTQNKK